jgi:hypothetical protein
MASTLQTYITQVRRLLHDANANFYTNQQLTDYINDARQRVVRDTGCSRTTQTMQVPATPVAGGSTPYIWTAGGTANTGDYVFFNIFIYQVTAGGTFGSQGPAYPMANGAYPPSTPFTNGTVTLQYAGNCEVVNYAAMPQGLQTLDIVNVNLYWGNSRIPLRYLPWTQFNAELRYWQNYIGRPIAFSSYGQQQFYIGPVPDQSYTVDIDTVVLPTPLVNLTDIDTINDPFTSPVQFYAAYEAKYYEQSFGEAELYLQQYKNHVQSVLASIYTRRIPDPYSAPY